MAGTRAVYYAINDDPTYVFLALKSVESLRKFNRAVKVLVFAHGKLKPRDARRFAGFGARVITQGEASKDRLNFLKWSALSRLGSFERVLFADADTLFFGDVNEIFDSHRKRLFYAREEAGTARRLGLQMLGTTLIHRTVDHRALSAIRRKLGSREAPIFNTGVMLFNHRSHRRIAAELELMEWLRVAFQRGTIAYPSSNPQLLDEIVLSLTLGMTGMEWERLSPRTSPWYLEWKGGAVPDPGVLMHFWSCYAPFGLRDFQGARALAGSPYQTRGIGEYRGI